MTHSRVLSVISAAYRNRPAPQAEDAPGNPGLTIGGEDDPGWTNLSPQAARAGAGSVYVERERAAQLEGLRRRACYTPGHEPTSAAGSLAIAVYCRLASGVSMIAALHAIPEKKPARLRCGVPVAPPAMQERLHPYVDEVVCLDSPPRFWVVGKFYRHFLQVEDTKLVACLKIH